MGPVGVGTGFNGCLSFEEAEEPKVMLVGMRQRKADQMAGSLHLHHWPLKTKAPPDPGFTGE